MPSIHGLFACCLCPRLAPAPPPLCPCGHHICPTCHRLTNEEQEEWLDEYLQVSLVEPCLLRGLWICETCELLSMMAVRACNRCGTERGETYRLVSREETTRWTVMAMLFCMEEMLRRGEWRGRRRGEPEGGEDEDQEEEEEEEEEAKHGDDEDEEDEDQYWHDDDEEE